MWGRAIVWRIEIAAEHTFLTMLPIYDGRIVRFGFFGERQQWMDEIRQIGPNAFVMLMDRDICAPRCNQQRIKSGHATSCHVRGPCWSILRV
jgi:hypothetical protein